MQENNFALPKFILGFNLLLIIIFPIFVEVFFALKYSDKFAVEELVQRGFEEIRITDDFLMSDRRGLVANKHVFLFQAKRDSQFIDGKLVCYRTFYDLGNSRCIFEAEFL